MQGYNKDVTVGTVVSLPVVGCFCPVLGTAPSMFKPKIISLVKHSCMIFPWHVPDVKYLVLDVKCLETKFIFQDIIRRCVSFA